MAYEENLKEWYLITLALITERINEAKGLKLTTDQVAKTISSNYNYTDNTEFFSLICKKGIMLYNDVEDLF